MFTDAKFEKIAQWSRTVLGANTSKESVEHYASRLWCDHGIKVAPNRARV